MQIERILTRAHKTKFGGDRLYKLQKLSSCWDGRPFGHNRHGPKIGGSVPLLGGAGSLSTPYVAWAEAYLRTKLPTTKWHLDPSSLLAIIGIGRKLGAAVSFLAGGEAGSPSDTVGWTEAYLHNKWHLNPSSRLATANMGRKFGRGCALLGGSLVPI